MDIIYRVTVEHDGEVEVKEFGSEAEAREYADARDKEIYQQYKEIDKNVCYRGSSRTGTNSRIRTRFIFTDCLMAARAR